MLNFISNALAAIPWNNTSHSYYNRKSSNEALSALKEIHLDSQKSCPKGIRQAPEYSKNYGAIGDESTSLVSKVYNFFFRSKEDAFKNRSVLHQMAHDIEKACPGNLTLLNNFKKEYALHLLTASPVAPKEFVGFLNRNLAPETTLDDFFVKNTNPHQYPKKSSLEIESA